MRTLQRAIQSTQSTGTRIHLPWINLDRTIHLATKELVILAGAPGGGKSTLAVNLAMSVDYPTLYVAQDSPASILSRMAAVGLDLSTDDARTTMARDRQGVAARMANVRPTLVFERGAKTVPHIGKSIVALTEWLGRPPPLVFIDNLIDLVVPGHTHSDNAFYSTALPELKQMANEYDTTIIALHHVIRSSDSRKEGLGRSGIKLSDLLYAGEREARHVWAVYNNGEDRLHVQILKQQDGRADPRGGVEEHLRWVPSFGKLIPDRGGM